MEESQKNLVDGLEHLVTICKDGEKGYQTAADNSKDEDLKTIFIQYSQQRAQYITELQALILNLGGNPNQGSDLTSALHRTWMDLKESFSGHDRQTLLVSCKRGDYAAIEAYNDFFGDVFEYTSSPTTHSLYTITGGTNRKYESTGLDSGNGLDNSSEGFSNTSTRSNQPKSDYSSTNDLNMNNVSERHIRNSENEDENSAENENISRGDFSSRSLPDNRLRNENNSNDKYPSSIVNDRVYSIVKAQLDGIELAHEKIMGLRDQISI